MAQSKPFGPQSKKSLQAQSRRQAAILGFDDADTEMLTLLLEILGWQKVVVTDLGAARVCGLPLVFFNGSGLGTAALEVLVAANIGDLVLAILTDGRLPFKAQAIAGDRLHWLTAPISVESAERAIAAGS